MYCVILLLLTKTFALIRSPVDEDFGGDDVAERNEHLHELGVTELLGQVVDEQITAFGSWDRASYHINQSTSKHLNLKYNTQGKMLIFGWKSLLPWHRWFHDRMARARKWWWWWQWERSNRARFSLESACMMLCVDDQWFVVIWCMHNSQTENLDRRPAGSHVPMQWLSRALIMQHRSRNLLGHLIIGASRRFVWDSHFNSVTLSIYTFNCTHTQHKDLHQWMTQQLGVQGSYGLVVVNSRFYFHVVTLLFLKSFSTIFFLTRPNKWIIILDFNERAYSNAFYNPLCTRWGRECGEKKLKRN